MDHALYRFYDANGALLYIGIALQPFARMGQHRREKSWWGEVATVTIEHHHSRADAVAAERDAIKAEKPKYNVVHNRGKPPVICTYTTWENDGLITVYNVAPLGRRAKCYHCLGLTLITAELIREQPKPPEVGPHGGSLPCGFCGLPAETNSLSDNGPDEYPGRVAWVSTS